MRIKNEKSKKELVPYNINNFISAEDAKERTYKVLQEEDLTEIINSEFLSTVVHTEKSVNREIEMGKYRADMFISYPICYPIIRKDRYKEGLKEKLMDFFSKRGYTVSFKDDVKYAMIMTLKWEP